MVNVMSSNLRDLIGRPPHDIGYLLIGKARLRERHEMRCERAACIVQVFTSYGAVVGDDMNNAEAVPHFAHCLCKSGTRCNNSNGNSC